MNTDENSMMFESSENGSIAGGDDGNESEASSVSQRVDQALRKLSLEGFLENFDPERSNRERRKLTRKISRGGQRQYVERKIEDEPCLAELRKRKKNTTVYDDKGLLFKNSKDLCDCLKEDCRGCHFPCAKCHSCKCGHECRQNRKWMIESIEIEGTGQVIRNNYL